MRILLAGASGVIGRRLVPMLVARGHSVAGTTRWPDRAPAIEAMGAEAVVCDVLDAEAVKDAVARARPEVVVQHLTDLPPDLNPRNLKRAYVANDRIRGEGTANLVAATEASGARRYVAQNVCFAYRPEGGPIKDEDAPIFTDAPRPFDRTARTYLEMEDRITGGAFDGLVLRFGFWYGPHTTYARNGYVANEVRRRRVPIVGDGGGIFSFVHIDDVALATIAALQRGSPGVYNVCDDEPAPLRDWLPAYADVLGAKPPRRVPRWLARLAVGRFATLTMTELRGASNEKAKRELGWEPAYPTWREGFREALG